MNEKKIRKLAEQAGMGYGNLSTGNGDNWIVAGKPEELEKFAELIVRECVLETMDAIHHDTSLRLQVYKHFGIEL